MNVPPARPPAGTRLKTEVITRSLNGHVSCVQRCVEYPQLWRMYRREPRHPPVVYWKLDGSFRFFPSLAEAWDAMRVEVLKTKGEGPC